MIINVLVETKVNRQKQTFSYLVPRELEKGIKVGIRVLVPFANRELEGFVMEMLDSQQNVDYQLKEVVSVVDEKPVLNSEMIELGEYMSNIYLAPLISCYQTMLPIALKAKNNTVINIKEEKYIVINKSKEEIRDYINSNKFQKQNEILELLIEKGSAKRGDVTSVSSINTLLKKGLIKEEKKEIYRLKEEFTSDIIQPTLTSDQAKVVNEIVNAEGDITFLLHGVTGSGKTEVYMSVIEDVLLQGKNAIVLVPEIALTAQLSEKFKERFGEKVAILHSRLSDGEKYDEWRKVEKEEVSIVIGARSAVFAPFSKIGIIIIDEEHETTYKQENNPRYNTIDIASYRAKKHNAKIILGSATPSLESYARAKKGIYRLLELKERINKKKLPQVVIVDMKDSIKKGNLLFSKELTDKIADRLKRKEQIMILLNRRGYANYMICSNCGYTHKCPNCDITLTYHKTSDVMRCHYCGNADKKHDICPSCKDSKMSSFGIGTERVEEELNKLFEGIRIVRMDQDTTSKKGSHSRIIKDFNNQKYDLLLGTQMIAKGLDFSKVTLVGVINSDLGLNIPDFRSGERTFQMLSQVAGRSGRSDIEGEVVFQTFNTDHYVMKMAKEHDYLGFYKEEMMIRKKLNYPPYCFVCLVKILCRDYTLGFEEAKKIGNFLRKNLPDNNVLGPTMAALLRVNNVYRFQCIIKYRNKEEIQKAMVKVLEHYEENGKIKLEIDFNPHRL